jgi:hypothetical protein
MGIHKAARNGGYRHDAQESCRSPFGPALVAIEFLNVGQLLAD